MLDWLIVPRISLFWRDLWSAGIPQPIRAVVNPYCKFLRVLPVSTFVGCAQLWAPKNVDAVHHDRDAPASTFVGRVPYRSLTHGRDPNAVRPLRPSPFSSLPVYIPSGMSVLQICSRLRRGIFASPVPPFQRFLRVAICFGGPLCSLRLSGKGKPIPERISSGFQVHRFSSL